ncbi:MAG: sodium:calcium antiporter [Nocardioidaceae bacterium]
MLTFLISVALLVLGAVALTAGAEAFAEHVGTAASRLGVSVLALGVLLAGAEPEEAVTAMLASGQGHPALAAGDAIGANLVILTLTIGLAALLRPLPVGRRVMEYAAAAAVAGALTVLFLWNGVLSRLEGALLVVAYAAGVTWVWQREKEPPMIGEMAELAEEAQEKGEGGTPSEAGEPSRALLFVVLGLVGMVLGGILAVNGAQGLVDVLDVSESVIGLTVLALATSAEMLALVWAAHRRGVTEIALAGAVGSVAYNATVSIGLAAMVRPLAVGKGAPVLTVGIATVVLPLLLLAGRRTGTLPRPLGFLLVAGYLVATGWLFSR